LLLEIGRAVRPREVTDVEELQVPTHRIDVELFVTSGAEIHGALFAPESPYHSGNPDDVIHLLNDEREFLPLLVEDRPAGPYVVNKTHIVRVHLPVSEVDRQDRLSTAPIDVEDCTVFLSNGTTLQGMLSIETPTTSSRLVDKLNLAAPFVPVYTGDGIDFVHKSHVVHVSS
jgi:hypothetical protein